MINLTQVIGQIRFGIEQLTSKNLFHDFEHLCRHLTRKRICSNITPSTGPVSAFGDQGVDFETFYSYLRTHFTNDSAYLGLLSDKPIVFCCSLDKEFDKKVKSDVQKITKNRPKIEKIIFFSGQDIPIGKRNKLQKWAEDRYQCQLEIHDAQSISELLADFDTFWIAVQYLSIPNEIFPRPLNEKNWYVKKHNYYKEHKDQLELNFEEFIEIKNVVRNIFKNEKYNSDLPLWISLLKLFIESSNFPLLQDKAIYEYLVLKRAGLETLDDDELLIIRYFQKLDNLDLTPTELEDLAVMLTYMHTANKSNLISLEDRQFGKWRTQIISIIEKQLQKGLSPNSKCLLFETRAFIEMTTLDSKRGFNLKNAAKWYNKLIKLVPNAPLYHLELLCDRFYDFIETFKKVELDTTEFENLVKKAEKHLAKRYGNYLAAEKATQRAKIYFNNKEYFKAIKTLHEIKIKTYTDERIKGSIYTMIVLSEVYQTLKLNYAAKYYSLIAAYFVLNNPNLDLLKYLTQSLIMAANSDFLQGSFLSFFSLIKFSLISHTNIEKEIFTDEHEQSILLNTAKILFFSEKYGVGLDNYLLGEIEKWGYIKEEIFFLKDELEKSSNSSFEKENFDRHLEDYFTDIPFNDLGNPRVIHWNGLGISWYVEFNNDYVTTSISEEFVSMFQIFQVELAQHDLCLIKTKIKISIEIIENGKITFESIPSNEDRIWKVSIPRYDKLNYIDYAEFSKTLFQVMTTILFEVSLLKGKDFVKIMEKNFKDDLSNKVTFFQFYNVIYNAFISETEFASIERRTKEKPNLLLNFKIPETAELDYTNKIGPTYTKREALKAIKNRYEHSVIPIKFTLQKIKKEESLKLLVSKLRAKGWKDWHILMALANLVINYKMNKKHSIIQNEKEFLEKFKDSYFTEEKENETLIPFTEVNEEKLHSQLQLTMYSTVIGWGLEPHQKTPDWPAIENFLSSRYNYWTDDIDHQDPFM